MSVRTVELRSINAASVWRLSLRIGLRIALIIGALMYAFGLPISLLYGVLSQTEQPWMPLVLVTILVPLFLSVFVVLVAGFHALGAWLYSQIGKLIGGLQVTLESDGAVHRIVRIEPRQALRWLFAQLAFMGLFIAVIMIPFLIIEAQSNIANVQYSLYSFFIFGLAQCISVLLTGILTLLLYNAMKQPVSVVLGQREQSTALLSVGIVVTATWMTVQAAISQLITVSIEQSGALGKPETGFFFSLFLLTPFLLLLVFLMHCLSYLIYNWGAQKWNPIAFELVTLTTESALAQGVASANALPIQSNVRVPRKVPAKKKTVRRAGKPALKAKPASAKRSR